MGPPLIQAFPKKYMTGFYINEHESQFPALWCFTYGTFDAAFPRTRDMQQELVPECQSKDLNYKVGYVKTAKVLYSLQDFIWIGKSKINTEYRLIYRLIYQLIYR